MPNIIVITSPPYIGQEMGYGDRPNRWNRVADNPNFKGRTHWANNDRPSGYGHTQGQLGAMKEGKMTLIESTVAANMPTEDWYGCYDEGWKGLITDDSFGHPAKMAKGLVYRIVREMLNRGWLTLDSVVIDPFGGVGSTGLACSAHGLRSISIELEPRFYRMANGYDCPGLPKTTLTFLNGAWIPMLKTAPEAATLCPACFESLDHPTRTPSFAPHHYVGNFDLHRQDWAALNLPQPVILQGDSRRLIEVIQQAEGVITSPPYIDTPVPHAEGGIGGRPEIWKDKVKGLGYGTTPGQIGAMPINAITSPPYEKSLSSAQNGIDVSKTKLRRKQGYVGPHGNVADAQQYSESPDNLGNMRIDKNVQSGVDYLVCLRCIHAKIVECRSPVDPDGVEPAQANGTATASKGGLSRSGGVPKSQPLISMSPVHFSQETNTITGKAERIDGEALLGVFSDVRLWTGMEMPAEIAVLLPALWQSITSSIKETLKGHGIIPLTTFSLSVESVTVSDTADSRCILCNVQFVGIRLTLNLLPTKPVLHPAAHALTPSSTTDGKQSAPHLPTDYWGAVAMVYSQLYQIMTPGGYMACVVKSFIKNKKLVDLPGQTLALLTSIGFEPVLWVNASVVDEEEQLDMFSEINDVKERKSFFRQLHEKRCIQRSARAKDGYYRCKLLQDTYCPYYKAEKLKPQWAPKDCGLYLSNTMQGLGIDDEVVLIVKKPGEGGGTSVMTSPPYITTDVVAYTGTKGDDWQKGIGGHKNQVDGYGQTEGQIGAMKPGTLDVKGAQ